MGPFAKYGSLRLSEAGFESSTCLTMFPPRPDEQYKGTDLFYQTWPTFFPFSDPLLHGLPEPRRSTLQNQRGELRIAFLGLFHCVGSLGNIFSPVAPSVRAIHNNQTQMDFAFTGIESIT